MYASKEAACKRHLIYSITRNRCWVSYDSLAIIDYRKSILMLMKRMVDIANGGQRHIAIFWYRTHKITVQRLRVINGKIGNVMTLLMRQCAAH